MSIGEQMLSKIDLLEWGIVILLIMAIVITIIGCSNIPQRPEYFQQKLNKIIKMDNQLGSMIGYHNRLLNSPMFINERLYQQLNGIPNSQISYQQFKKIESKYGL